MTTLYLRIVFFSVLFLTSHHLANACEFGPAENREGVSHPRSADVTSALRDAKTAGILETNSVGLKNGEVLDTRSIVGRMQRFGNALASSGAEAASSLSILLVEDEIWSRYRAMPEGVAFQMQTRGAQADDTVIITGEAVLAAMEDGILSSNEAILRGLIVIVPGDSIDDRKVLSALASFAKADNPDQIALKRSRSLPSWPD